jgi:hypothetical protein
MRRHPLLPAAGLAAALSAALFLVGCGGDNAEDSPAPAQAAATTTAAPAADPASEVGSAKAGSAGSSPMADKARSARSASSGRTEQVDSAPSLPDGTHPVYLTGADASAGTVTVDVVQFFEGQAAVDAAAEDSKGTADFGDADYYVRNANPRLRTVPVSPNAIITLWPREDADAREVDLAQLEGFKPTKQWFFWMELKGGKLVDLNGSPE